MERGETLRKSLENHLPHKLWTINGNILDIALLEITGRWSPDNAGRHEQSIGWQFTGATPRKAHS